MTSRPGSILVRHPDTPCSAVESIEFFLSSQTDGILQMTGLLKGAVEQLRIPPYQAPRRGDGLWRHTCFEAFIGAKNDAEYYEFNFSPAGEWAVYEFRDYRDGGPMEVVGFEPTISVERDAKTVELSVGIRWDRLPRLQLDVRLWVGLSAVIEDKDGKLSYWALRHPPGRPDFHHPESFVLEIGSPLAVADAEAYTAKT